MNLSIKQDLQLTLTGNIDVDGSNVVLLNATIKQDQVSITEIIKNNAIYQANTQEISLGVAEFKKLANNIGQTIKTDDFGLMINDVLELGGA